MHQVKLAAALAAASILASCAQMPASPGKRELMVVGIDEKVLFNGGKQSFGAPGRDAVSIVDIGTDPLAPRIVANLPLMNSIFGPPVNLAITPDETLAIVANSMDWQQDGGNWKPVPDSEGGEGAKLYIQTGSKMNDMPADDEMPF